MGTERSYPWDGQTVGDVGTYSRTKWERTWNALGRTQDTDKYGVFIRSGGALVPTGAAPNITIGVGEAIVDGTFYELTGSSNTIAIPTPSSNSRIDRIVLRKDSVLNTVRLTRIAGTEDASPVPPAILTSPQFDLKVTQVHITTGGTITIRDERQYVDINNAQARLYHGTSTMIIVPGWSFDEAVNGTAMVDKRIYFCPIYIPYESVFDRLSFEVTTLESAKNARLGIYEARLHDSLKGILPGALIESSADISIASTGIKTHTLVDKIRKVGWYFLAYMSDTAGATARFMGVDLTRSISMPITGLNISDDQTGTILRSDAQGSLVLLDFITDADIDFTSYHNSAFLAVRLREEA